MSNGDRAGTSTAKAATGQPRTESEETDAVSPASEAATELELPDVVAVVEVDSVVADGTVVVARVLVVAGVATVVVVAATVAGVVVTVVVVDGVAVVVSPVCAGESARAGAVPDAADAQSSTARPATPHRDIRGNSARRLGRRCSLSAARQPHRLLRARH
jgi:hypothetical protein